MAEKTIEELFADMDTLERKLAADEAAEQRRQAIDEARHAEGIARLQADVEHAATLRRSVESDEAEQTLCGVSTWTAAGNQ
jgi:hypothetical protein